MPDAGSFIYSGDPENRAWFRQTKVHQTLTLNGKNSAYAPNLLLWKPGKDLDVLVVENASYPDLTHRRAVLFVDKKFFVIVDEAMGSAMGDIDLHFQLGPGNAIVDKQNQTVSSNFSEGWNVMVKSVDQKDMKLIEEEGQVSFIYTKKEPRPAFCFNLKKEAVDKNVRFITVVAPYNGTKPDVSVSISSQIPIGAARVELIVSSDGKTRRINYDLPVK
jgi:heparan-sulfate lyase